LGQKPIRPIPLKPVDSLTIIYLIDNVADGLASDKGPARRPRMAMSRKSTPLTTPTDVVEYLVAEVGFAAMVTVQRNTSVSHLLFDAGRSPNGLVENMERLGFDPKQIEAVVLSHGHWDHVTGLDGLPAPFEAPRSCLLFCIRTPSRNGEFQSGASPPLELPTLSRSALREAGFELIEERAPSTLFDSSVLITGEIDRTCPFEKGMSSPHEAWRDGR
jgi:7,8-dihydropterin-6-yl-methyl-4-(beta-D-ribofuranosyl)aminobenzene 5'-phosphate synthase